MNRVLNETKNTLLHEEDAVVCTILQSEGSTPGKTGAMMLVTQSGKTYGTVGGGKLEFLCINKAMEVYKKKQTFTETLQLAEDADMICGGKLTVEYTYISKDTPVNMLNSILHIEESQFKVIVFGAGHVGKELVKILNQLNLDTVLLDDRKNLETDYVLCNYDDIESSVQIEKKDYVVVMTHGHLADRTVLLQVCRIKPEYIGCMGSIKKLDATSEYLSANGIDKETIKSIHTPIGMEIGAQTPAEIAVSVAAELIKEYRHEKV